MGEISKAMTEKKQIEFTIISENVIKDPFGRTFVTNEYMKEMMRREYQRGFNEGLREPVIHKAELIEINSPK